MSKPKAIGQSRRRLSHGSILKGHLDALWEPEALFIGGFTDETNRKVFFTLCPCSNGISRQFLFHTGNWGGGD